MAFAGVTILRCSLRHEAELAKSHLAAAQITAWLADEGIVAANPLLAYAVGGIKVQVAAADEARARAALGELLDPGEGERCLACGTALAPEESACSKCGWTWD